jgi:hypothetical protein
MTQPQKDTHMSGIMHTIHDTLSSVPTETNTAQSRNVSRGGWVAEIPSHKHRCSAGHDTEHGAVIAKYSVRISAGTTAILSEVLGDFLQPLMSYVQIVS